MASAATNGTADPLGTLRLLQEKDAALDQALAATRDAQAQAARARQQLEHAMLAARSEIAAANDFITTRRGAVGSEARTRLATAQQHYDAAVQLANSDPAQALQHAQYADALAQQASAIAQQDVQQWESQQGAGRGGFGGQGRGGMGNLGGLILGGILIDSILGGGRGGGGFGGDFGPGSFGGGGGGGGFGGDGGSGGGGGF